MFDSEAPKTLEEAREYRYNKWRGNPRGYAYNPKYCAFEVWSAGRGSLPDQCCRTNGHGPAELYCKQHEKRVEAATEKALGKKK